MHCLYSLISLAAILHALQWSIVVTAKKVATDEVECRKFAVNLHPAHIGRYSYENVTLRYGNVDDYVLHKRIGGGAYGDIFIGENQKLQQQVVIKKYHKLNLKKMNREIVITQDVCGGPHIAKLVDVLDFPDSQYPALVLELVQSTSYEELFSILKPIDVQRYMYQFLMALHYAHNHYIIHYDLKPDNILIHYEKKDLKLIDWGLSRYILPGEPIKTAGTLHYKSPEMLVEYQGSDAATDMWSYGCIFAEWIFRRKEAFFPGGFHNNQLNEIAKVLGTEELQEYLNKYEIKRSLHDVLVNIHHKKSHQSFIDWQFLNVFIPTPSHSKVSLNTFINEMNEDYATTEAIDLLSKLLRYDHKERLTAYEAMQHPYFDNIRAEQNALQG